MGFFRRIGEYIGEVLLGLSGVRQDEGFEDYRGSPGVIEKNIDSIVDDPKETRCSAEQRDYVTGIVWDTLYRGKNAFDYEDSGWNDRDWSNTRRK